MAREGIQNRSSLFGCGHTEGTWDSRPFTAIQLASSVVPEQSDRMFSRDFMKGTRCNQLIWTSLFPFINLSGHPPAATTDHVLPDWFFSQWRSGSCEAARSFVGKMPHMFRLMQVFGNLNQAKYCWLGGCEMASTEGYPQCMKSYLEFATAASPF